MPRSSAETLDRILGSAFRLFFQRGYSRVSMDEIANTAGVTKRTLYNHFDSKDALIGAVLRRQADLSLATVQQWSDPQATTAAAFLDRLFLKLGAWARSPGWTGSGFTRLTLELSDLPGHPARHAAHSHKQAIQDWLAGELSARGCADAPAHAATVCIPFEGALVLALIHGDASYIDHARAVIATMDFS